MNTLGARIKLARGEMTQDVFAKLLQISKGSLGFYERDENLPNTDVILKICSFTGVDLKWLVAGHGDMWSVDRNQKKNEERPATTTLQTDSPSCRRCLELSLELIETQKHEKALMQTIFDLKLENANAKLLSLSKSANEPGDTA